MNLTQEISENGVTERHFELTVTGELVPGVIWAPEGARGPRPLLLIGHGGSQHKLFAPIAASAKRYAQNLRYAVVTIDAPKHGARTTPEESARASEKMRQHFSTGGGLHGEILTMMLTSATQAASEWRAVLDAVTALDFIGEGGPIGYAGLSMGGMTGLLLAAGEPRIKAAVIGLVGQHEGSNLLITAARSLKMPVEFLMQWDDELVPRNAALSLFDAIASAEKTLHANPGEHGTVPPFERQGWMQFFVRNLGAAEALN